MAVPAFRSFRREFHSFIRTAPHWQLKELSAELRHTTKKRFISGHPKKCELVERGFTDAELARFLDVVKCPIDRACFMFMAVLGLRPCEVSAMRGRDLEGDQLRIPARKGGRAATLRIPPPLLQLIPCAGPDEPIFRRSPKNLRDRFNKYRAEANLNEQYMITEPCGKAGTCNRRFRITLYSLRHYAIQRIYMESKDPDLARRFARHKKLETTLEYFKSSRKEELEALLEHICEPRALRAYNTGRSGY
jgi:integrase